ncbi:biotin-dependent carboxyltransferase family protein [Paenibacillus sp. SI8]|uniref:5-oxoprolinase subunit C family protein n=1 Tax=unclassified Paenibacillus TaxID=185978 RepID=UPI003467B69C
MSFVVVKSGLLTTIQDNGRLGLRKHGVITSGPMDRFAHRTANLLVGNTVNTASMELTLQGAELHAQKDMLLALCGADMEAVLDGQPVPLWRPFVIQSGSVLRMHYAVQGCRVYLAVAGGFDVEPVMGSRSTYMRAGLGGFEGRALQQGDILSVGAAEPNGARMFQAIGKRGASEGQGLLQAPWLVYTGRNSDYEDHPVVRIVRGREAAWFTAESMEELLAGSYEVTPHSDRMGYRLGGGELKLGNGFSSEMISDAVAQGTIQVPPSGQPILLMADCQTTGGYPRIGQVISADLPLVAQIKPGGRIRFREVSLREAQEELLLQEGDLRMLQAGVHAWLRDRG